MKILGKYKNGNYFVRIYDDGTKIRYNNEKFFDADTIESMDLKITGYCDMGCPQCHENSTVHGKHGDIMSESFIDRLHPFTEIAIGGGNPLSHPDLYRFLLKCKNLNLIPSMTINQIHFESNIDFITKLVNEKMIYGLGVSLMKPTNEFVEKIKMFPNAVVHTIAGIVSRDDIDILSKNNIKILVLGYKTFRRGVDYREKYAERIDNKIQMLKSILPIAIDNKWFSVVSFDNLAIKQLNVKEDIFHNDEEKWNKFFMGDDGIDGNQTSATMYVDMVDRKFAKNSCSEKRFDIMDNVEDMYNFLKNN